MHWPQLHQMNAAATTLDIPSMSLGCSWWIRAPFLYFGRT